MLVVLVAGIGVSDSEAKTVINGDVTIDHDVSWADDTYEVHGNVTVLGGHTLRLSRAILEIVGTGEGTHRLEVMAGAELIADNSTIRGAPYAIGVEFAGMVSMFTCTLEELYVSNVTPAINVTGVLHMESCLVWKVRNDTAIRVTGTLEAISCQIMDLGEVAIIFEDPSGPRDSYLRDCLIRAPTSSTLDTFGVLISWTETTTQDVSLNVTDCRIYHFTHSIQGQINTSTATLDVLGTKFMNCGNGVVVSGHMATVSVVDCVMDGSGNGLQVHVVEPTLPSISLTTRNLAFDGFTTGVHIRGPAHGFKPLLRNITVVNSGRGVYAHGSTVLVEDSSVTECGVCFYVEYGGRIEVRRTEHEHRSGAFTPGPESAVVAFTVINITSCRWENAQPITEGFLFLIGNDNVELDRVDLADPRPLEVVAWSITKYNDLGRLWIIPEYRTDGHEFKAAANISIYNLSTQQVELVDHQPPVISGVEPEDGTWLASSDVTVLGRLEENGSGLAFLAVRIREGVEIEPVIGYDGWWTVTFEDVPDGHLTIEVIARDNSGGTTTATIEDVTVDTTRPTIDLDGGDDMLVITIDIAITGRTEPISEVHVWEMDVPPDHPYNCNVTIMADGDGNFNATVCLGDGLHRMSITSTDRAGNVGQRTFTVAMDPTPPRLEISSPEDEAWVNVTELDFSGFTGDGVGPSSWISGWIDGEEWFVERDEVGIFTVMVELTEGMNEIVFKVVDEAGNMVTLQVTVHVDTTPPLINVVEPKELRFFTTETKIDLQGDVREGSLHELTLNWMPLDLISGIFTAALTIREGENVFVISAVDRAGNSAEVTIVILRDLMPPDFTYETAFPDGQTLDVDGTLFATYTGSGTPQLEFTFQVSEASTVTASEGRGQVEGEGNLTLTIDLEEGGNVITFSVVDEAGNAAAPVTYRIVLDTTPPEIRVDAPRGDVRTKDRNYRIRGKVEEGSTLVMNGNRVPVNPDGTFNVQVDLVVGENSFQLVATDKVGLKSDQNVTLTRQKEADEGPGPGAVAALAVLTAVAAISRRRLSR